MSAPQIIMACLLTADWTVCLCCNGQPRKPYSVRLQTVAVAIMVALLWWGGFWQ